MFAQPAADLAGTQRGREAQALLRNCVHCGFCLPACPTYRATGNELDSPRGRIYLIKQIVEGAAVTATTRDHLDRCLTCRACERACPSGVEYGRLIDLGRELVEDRAPRTLPQRSLRHVLVAVLSRPRLFTALLRTGQAVRQWLPASLRARIPPSLAAHPTTPRSRHARRVVLLEGCVQPGLAPAINAAVARVLDRLGIATERLAGEQCCGALGHHLGYAERALGQARRNVDACCAALDAGAEAIVSSASACGLMVKDYGRLLAHDPEYADRARRVSSATRDIAEIITPADLERIGCVPGTGPRVAWQAPCTLQHGQRLAGRVEPLLVAAGCTLEQTRESTLCCGSAGTYSLLQPGLSRELRRRKIEALTPGAPDVIATGNIGCLEHLRAASAVPVRHWIEVVDDALDRAAVDRPSARTCLAGKGHLEEIVRLLAIQLREHRIELERARLEDAVRGVLNDPSRGFFLVLELDGRCVGAAYVSFIWALEHGGHSAWLEEIYVEPSRRAAGLGSDLLRAVLAECETRGCTALDLEIDTDHERVRSLYRRHGFEELPRHRLVKRLRGRHHGA